MVATRVSLNYDIHKHFVKLAYFLSSYLKQQISDVVKMIYAKAETLISNSDILPAPRASVSFKSVSNTAGYHITTIKENNKALCDCKSFKSLKMCSHVLASAHLSVRYHRQKHPKRIGLDQIEQIKTIQQNKKRVALPKCLLFI